MKKQHGNFVDHTNKRYGKIVVVKCLNEKLGRRTLWLCQCDCGKLSKHPSSKLYIGRCTASCLLSENVTKAKRYKENYPDEYVAWMNMKDRCRNKNRREAHRYANRGISVCNRWKVSFENFLSDMGKRPKGMMLERKNNNKGYSPNNCIWATSTQQQRNKCNNRILKIDGVPKCMAEWADESPVAYATIRARLKRGWSAKRAIYTPKK